jgi:surface antigen
MRERGHVTVKCGRTAPASIDNAVKYGGTVKYEGIACRSSTNGLECRNADGHGFFLSRARQSVF